MGQALAVKRDGLTFDMLWYAEESVVDSVTARCSNPVAVKQDNSFCTVHNSWYEVLLLICCVWVLPNVALCILVKHVHFGLICAKNIAQKHLSWPKLCCLLSREKTYFWQFFQTRHTFSVFLIVLSWTWTFYMLMMSVESEMIFLWALNCISTGLNVPDMQTAKTSAVIEVFTLMIN